MKHSSLLITSLLLSSVACSCSDKNATLPNNAVPDDVIFASLNTRPVTRELEVSACPPDMVEVSGEYCTNVEQTCLRKEKNVNGYNACMEYAPSVCIGERVHIHYCVDRYEYPNVPGEKPKSWMSWGSVKSACEAGGKRLCTDKEWTFACEGPDMHPYPYGDGYHRDHTACNTENPIAGLNVFKATSHDTPMAQILDDLLVPAGSMNACVSDFGVHDLVGNIDEEVVNTSGYPYQSGLKGGHVFGVRNSCRPMTEAHNEGFAWYETGGRCCSDPTP